MPVTGRDRWGKRKWGGRPGEEVVPPPIFNFTGNLGPGETIVIDCKAKTIKIDGANVLKYFAGRFPDLPPGAVTVTYKDSEDSRTLAVTITSKDKWI